MDIENFEWLVLPDLEKSGALKLVDELIVEIHFDTKDPKWGSFIRRVSVRDLLQNEGGIHMQEEAFDLLHNLRSKGVYPHTYP